MAEGTAGMNARENDDPRERLGLRDEVGGMGRELRGPGELCVLKLGIGVAVEDGGKEGACDLPLEGDVERTLDPDIPRGRTNGTRGFGAERSGENEIGLIVVVESDEEGAWCKGGGCVTDAARGLDTFASALGRVSSIDVGLCPTELLGACLEGMSGYQLSL
jgi:hypothetical protein